MLKKLILLLVILGTLYVLAVFKFPEISDTISSKVGLGEINTQIRDSKNIYDDVVTDIPTKDELIDTYGEAFSGAIKLKDTAKDKLDMAKDKIDNVRSTLSGAEDTYNEVKETVGDAKEFVEGISGKVDDIKSTVEKVGELTETFDEVKDTITK